MRKALLFTFMILLTFTACNGQNKDKTTELVTDSIKYVQPKTNIVVNKEYDEDGNLIKYDSTYSYYYSNIEGDTTIGDSIFNDFKVKFNKRYIFSQDPFFDNIFFQDSLLQYDFYNNNFFIERFRKNQDRLNKLFFDMDSIKNDFFFKQFKKPNNKSEKSM
ncbi:MAG: hypothetical protein L3J41_03930 [Melioribacteraceae bacterium]|nr:hypothetical protein [Melioribacteraceae bacterium]